MNNLISLKRVIAKIYSDLSIDEENVPVTDIIEWSAEALEKIESPNAYTQKVTGKEGIPLKEIKDYQAQLPLDCRQVIQVAYAEDAGADSFYPMKYASGSFSGNYGLTKDIDLDHIDDNTNLGSGVADSDVVSLTMDLYDLTYEEAVSKLNTDENVRSALINLLQEKQSKLADETTSTDILEYKIVPGYIKTNVKDGYLMVSYLAIPTDYDGYPMLPDNQSFIEAVFWYVATKLFYQQWVKGVLKDKELYQHAASKWRFYVKQAYGKSVAPKTLDEHESLKNNWLRLLPKVNQGESFFKDLNKQQRLYNI